jgi:hypothetical protein
MNNHFTPTIMDGLLYHCGTHAGRIALAKRGLNGNQINNECMTKILSLEGLDLASSSPMDIRKYLVEKPYNECSLCYQKPNMEAQVQLTEVEYSQIVAELQ